MVMMRLLATCFIGCMVCIRADGQSNSTLSTATSTQTVETIVCIRHGEKPDGGLGQLTCRGLNRTLALPAVLLAKYGCPQFVFAPTPTQREDNNNKEQYSHVRPLKTIEPTASRCGLPVNTRFGVQEIKGLEGELEKPAYRNATIFIAWEHNHLDNFVKDLIKAYGGDSTQVPPWPHPDYDTIFVVKITRGNRPATVAFTIDHENLNNLSDICP